MRRIGSLAAAIVLGLAGAVSAEDAAAFKGDPYTLNVCSISGEELGGMGEPISLVQDGRDLKFCCSGCPPRFKADVAKGLAKIDALMITDQKPDYPLKTDIVTGEALPADDKVVDVIYFNRLVRFASQKNAQTFMKGPDAYITKLNDAVIAAQKDHYPIDKCVVSGEKLTGKEDVQGVYANRLVKFCCDDCVKDFAKTPAKYLSMLEKGEAPKEGSGPHEHHEEHK